MRRSRSRQALFGTTLGLAWVTLACSSGDAPAGSAAGSGGRSAAGGAAAQSGSSGAGGVQSPGQSASDRCAGSALTWKTANKTNYTSYPDPGSEECIEFSGCKYQGMFAACDDTKSEGWVSIHNIVAIFPNLGSYALHDLCLSKPDGSDKIVVTVYDTCMDSDCDGCCSQNRGGANALIDVEHYTDARWGVVDGPIMWADLGPTLGDGCDGK